MFLKQVESEEEYIQKFIELATLLPKVSNEVLEGAFKAGLNNEVRNELVLLNPRNLEQMMIKSQQIEVKTKEVGRMRSNQIRWGNKSKDWTRGVKIKESKELTVDKSESMKVMEL